MFKKICIEAGHGSKDGKGDTGAIAPDGTFESLLNLAVVKQFENYASVQLKENLDQQIITFCPRREEEPMDLMERVYFANRAHCDAYLSVHCNAVANHPEANGYNVFYGKPRPKDKEFAEKISASMSAAGFTAWGEAVLDDTRAAVGSLAVCRYTDMPSSLVELGFITNPGDLAALKDEKIQLRIVVALYEAVRKQLFG